MLAGAPQVACMMARDKETARKLEAAAALRARLCQAAVDANVSSAAMKGLLDIGSLGGELPTGEAIKPFVCAVRIEVRGQTVEQAVEQGVAIVREVEASFERGPVVVSSRQGPDAGKSCVMWENLGAHSIRLDASKSNRINWLDKSWSARALEPSSTWTVQQELLARVLPHAASWTAVLQRAFEDGGIDIKDDCRLEDSSARCHQDGGNFDKPGRPPPLVRLAINLSNVASRRSLDYLEMSSNGRLVDGAERKQLLLHSVSQHPMWHGAAQTTAAYAQGISRVCHGSSAGSGPCLKRLVTVFALAAEHPLAGLTAVERLHLIGIDVYALEVRHMVMC